MRVPPMLLLHCNMTRRYVIRQRIIITKPNLVLRGAGQDETTLYFPLSLTQVYGNV